MKVLKKLIIMVMAIMMLSMAVIATGCGDDGKKKGGNKLPAGAYRMDIPAFEAMDYIAMGKHGYNVDGYLDNNPYEFYVGEDASQLGIDKYKGVAIKAYIKNIDDDFFWIAGISVNAAETSKDQTKFNALEKMTFDYTCTQDFTADDFANDLQWQVVFKATNPITNQPFEAFKVQHDIKLQLTAAGELATCELVLTEEEQQQLQTAMFDYPDLWFDFIQIGFQTGSSLDQFVEEGFEDTKLTFGNLVFYNKVA